jgi:hypothetical protein
MLHHGWIPPTPLHFIEVSFSGSVCLRKLYLSQLFRREARRNCACFLKLFPPVPDQPHWRNGMERDDLKLQSKGLMVDSNPLDRENRARAGDDDGTDGGDTDGTDGGDGQDTGDGTDGTDKSDS